MRAAETSPRDVGDSGRLVHRPTGMPVSDRAGVAAGGVATFVRVLVFAVVGALAAVVARGVRAE